ncbi:MAG: hypothetical protein IPJ65_24785 [Archangiaceae bacterium]|nr:hypothetical protein [Archangiaceae bacterium]
MSLDTDPLVIHANQGLVAKKEKKKRKKEKKREAERARALEAEGRQARATPSMSALELDGTAPAAPAAATAPAPAPAPMVHIEPPRARAQKWLQPIARGLDNDRMLTATKSSFMIAINGTMLAITAHALYRDPGEGTLWLALVPLALTNLFSLVFAIVSAQVRERPTNFDQLWEKNDSEYEPALGAMLESKERIFGAISEELHLHGAALAKSRRHLRTAYHVLGGGMVLTALTFAVCLVLGNSAAPDQSRPFMGRQTEGRGAAVSSVQEPGRVE